MNIKLMMFEVLSNSHYAIQVAAWFVWFSKYNLQISKPNILQIKPSLLYQQFVEQSIAIRTVKAVA